MWGSPTELMIAVRAMDLATLNDERRAARLAVAVSDGNVEDVRSVLALANPHANPRVVVNTEYMDLNEMTPLHNAVQKNLSEIVDLLITAGANVHARLDDEILYRGHLSTPLHWARRVDIFRRLIEAGADIHAADGNGQTVLHYLASDAPIIEHMIWGEHFREFMNILTLNGVNLETRDMNGNTPLIIAIKSDNFEVMNDLLELGAEKNVMNREGRSALNIAIQYERIHRHDALIPDARIIARLITAGARNVGPPEPQGGPNFAPYAPVAVPFIGNMRRAAWLRRRHFIHAAQGGGLARTKRRSRQVRRRKLKSRKVKRN